MLQRIISGGQTGVDRAALDAALENNFPCGGWCPKGRRGEDGPIPARYPVKETEVYDYSVRTERNVKESDGTLIITKGRPTGGTAYTVEVASKYEKPCLVLDLEQKKQDFASIVKEWIEKNNIQILNVAGPRESKAPGIYKAAKDILSKVIERDALKR